MHRCFRSLPPVCGQTTVLVCHPIQSRKHGIHEAPQDHDCTHDCACRKGRLFASKHPRIPFTKGHPLYYCKYRAMCDVGLTPSSHASMGFMRLRRTMIAHMIALAGKVGYLHPSTQGFPSRKGILCTTANTGQCVMWVSGRRRRRREGTTQRRRYWRQAFGAQKDVTLAGFSQEVMVYGFHNKSAHSAHTVRGQTQTIRW